MPGNKFRVRDLIYDRTKVLPFNQVDGPNGSTLLFYQFGSRVWIIQAFADEGWAEYIGSDTNNTELTFGMMHACIKERALQ